jgi:hypothetical protein
MRTGLVLSFRQNTYHGDGGTEKNQLLSGGVRPLNILSKPKFKLVPLESAAIRGTNPQKRLSP